MPSWWMKAYSFTTIEAKLFSKIKLTIVTVYPSMGLNLRENGPTLTMNNCLNYMEVWLKPTPPSVRKAKQALESGNINEAIEIYSKVLKPIPIDEATLCGLALVYQTDGKMDKTIDAYKKALQVNPSS